MEFTQRWGKKGEILANSLPQFSLDIVAEIAGFVINQIKGTTAKRISAFSLTEMLSILDFCVDEKEQIWCIVSGQRCCYVQVFNEQGVLLFNVDSHMPRRLTTDHHGASIWVLDANGFMRRYNSRGDQVDILPWRHETTYMIIGADTNQEGLMAVLTIDKWTSNQILFRFMNGKQLTTTEHQHIALTGVSKDSIYLKFVATLKFEVIDIHNSERTRISRGFPSQCEYIDSSGRMFILYETNVLVFQDDCTKQKLASVYFHKTPGMYRRIIAHDGFLYCLETLYVDPPHNLQSRISKYCFV